MRQGDERARRHNPESVVICADQSDPVMDRRGFVGAVVGVLLAAAATAAEQAGRVPRIGYLSPLSASVAFPPRAAFRQGLRELGWVEGQNIAIDWRFAENHPDQLPSLAAELVRLKVDLIFTETTPGARAAQQATATIPIVFNAVADPVGSGLVDNLARPGRNITGLSFLGGELTGKRFELLKEAIPGMTRVALIVQPGVPSEATINSIFEATLAVARASGVQLQRVDAQGPQEFEKAFAAMSRERAGGLILLPSAMFLDERTRIVDLAAKNRLPAIFFFKEFVEAGGLMSYGADFPELGRRAAMYVDKILRGAHPADLPVQQPTKFELIINLKTAKTLGIAIPQSLSLRADEVIQ